MNPAGVELYGGLGQRLWSYWVARNGFLQAGARIAGTDDLRKLLQIAGAALLAIVLKSPDFSSAYDPLLTLARHLTLIEPAASRDLLLELEQANPLQNDALRLRNQLFPGKR